jgi:hypothetical protein
MSDLTSARDTLNSQIKDESNEKQYSLDTSKKYTNNKTSTLDKVNGEQNIKDNDSYSEKYDNDSFYDDDSDSDESSYSDKSSNSDKNRYNDKSSDNKLIQYEDDVELIKIRSEEDEDEEEKEDGEEDEDDVEDEEDEEEDEEDKEDEEEDDRKDDIKLIKRRSEEDDNELIQLEDEDNIELIKKLLEEEDDYSFLLIGRVEEEDIVFEENYEEDDIIKEQNVKIIKENNDLNSLDDDGCCYESSEVECVFTVQENYVNTHHEFNDKLIIHSNHDNIPDDENGLNYGFYGGVIISVVCIGLFGYYVHTKLK